MNRSLDVEPTFVANDLNAKGQQIGNLIKKKRFTHGRKTKKEEILTDKKDCHKEEEILTDKKIFMKEEILTNKKYFDKKKRFLQIKKIFIKKEEILTDKKCFYKRIGSYR